MSVLTPCRYAGREQTTDAKGWSRLCRAALILCFTASWSGFKTEAAWGLHGLGYLDPSNPSRQSAALGISGDGTTVVGKSTSPNATAFEAFMWTQSGGMVGLGDLAGGDFNSWANSANYDGTLIVGMGTVAPGSTSKRHAAVVDVSASPPVWNDLGVIGSSSNESEAHAIVTSSGNTSGTVVGWSGRSRTEAFSYAWSSGPMTGLGTLDGAGSSVAYDIASAVSGEVIVGTSDAIINSTLTERAFRKIGAGAMEDLGTLGGSSARALGVSPDGNWIVGSSTVVRDVGGQNVIVREAFLSNGLIQPTDGIGDLGLNDGVNDNWNSEAMDVSSDGKVVVGWGMDDMINTDAFVYFRDTQTMHTLWDLLVANGVTMTGWARLIEATGVSDDGTVVVGRGQTTDGHEQAFVAWIEPPVIVPEPEDYALIGGLALAGFGILRRRRHRS